MAKTGRPPRDSFTVEDLDGIIDALKERIKRLAAIQKGMQATKRSSLRIENREKLEAALLEISTFCDTGLLELRKITQRGERPWDEWEY